MTGCYPRRLNLHVSDKNTFVLQPVAPKGLNPAETTVAEVMKSAGYATAIIGIKQLSDRLQVWEILYQSRMTNTDLIEWLKAHATLWHITEQVPLYADAAEPNRIEELKRAGFAARAANKSVKDGIDFCKAQALEVHSSAARMEPAARLMNTAGKDDP